jgi:hypothetical protein
VRSGFWKFGPETPISVYRSVVAMKKHTGKTHYSVSAGASGGNKVFRDVRLPGGDRVRVMDRQVFESALRAASEKFRSPPSPRIGSQPKK